ncbi:ankyrin repeat-containing domain protein [Aspergillus keveii]|uniref:Ankyrin repeat-containing domain protein n=1 Tax=Aspergillus keveii TaxID=714993 RepID=A0ABR4FSX2_9EURO
MRNIKVMSILLEYGASPHTPDEIGSSALARAAALGYPDLVRLLIQHGAHADSTDCLGRTPLFKAVMARRIDVVEILLGTGDVDTHSKTCAGRTPVSVASDAKSSKIPQILANWKDSAGPTETEACTKNADDMMLNSTDSQVPRYCDICMQPLLDTEPYFACQICKPTPKHKYSWMPDELSMCLECVAGGLGCYDKLHTLKKKVRLDGKETRVKKIVRWRQTAFPVRAFSQQCKLLE